MPDWKPRKTGRARELRNAATPAERALWTHLRSSKLGSHEFSRQMPVGPFFADFLCRRSKLIVELDGGSHDLTVEEDARRTAYLERAGYRIIRFMNAKVFKNPEGVLALIAEKLTDLPTPGPSRKREGR